MKRILPFILKNRLQLYILCTGAISISLISTLNPVLQFYGFAIGLAGQPAWIIDCYRSRKYGMFAMSAIYTASMLNGLRNTWGV
jgi:hypothetical protein